MMVPIVRWCDGGDGEADETARKRFCNRHRLLSQASCKPQSCRVAAVLCKGPGANYDKLGKASVYRATVEARLTGFGISFSISECWH